jgi:hypothetical protein
MFSLESLWVKCKYCYLQQEVPSKLELAKQNKDGSNSPNNKQPKNRLHDNVCLDLSRSQFFLFKEVSLWTQHHRSVRAREWHTPSINKLILKESSEIS